MNLKLEQVIDVELKLIKNMTDDTLIKLYGNIIRYKCPCCGEIKEYHESTIETMKENGKTYFFCDECDNKIKI